MWFAREVPLLPRDNFCYDSVSCADRCIAFVKGCGLLDDWQYWSAGPVNLPSSTISRPFFQTYIQKGRNHSHQRVRAVVKVLWACLRSQAWYKVWILNDRWFRNLTSCLTSGAGTTNCSITWSSHVGRHPNGNCPTVGLQPDGWTASHDPTKVLWSIHSK